jgi:L-lactate dehydrogenase complex protein LldG
MSEAVDDNRKARDAILGRVREALAKDGPDSKSKASADAYIAAHRHGPRPAMPTDLRSRFITRATDMSSTVELVGSRAEIPRAVERYLDTLARNGSPRLTAGVCWPEFADLDWAAAGLSVESRPASGSDRLAITGSYCAIAETGTILITSGASTPTASALLPDTHVAVVRADRIVSGLEEAFALVRSELRAMPRAFNFISGPSRTGDIEQTIVLGAHGPFRVHLLVLG